MSTSTSVDQSVTAPVPRTSPENGVAGAHRAQLRLPGQASAPDGPIDLSGMFLMHFGFRRDLAAFSAAAAATPADDRETWAALNKRFRRFASVLHHHHSGEDAGLWPMLLERAKQAGSDEDAATLHAMEAEHAVVDPLLGACARMLTRLASAGEEGVRAKLATKLETLDESLRQHLAHEETDALALVQRYLTPADWGWLEKEHFSKAYKPWEVPFALCWVLHELPDEARQLVFAIPGAPPRRIWTLLRPGFERRERRAFRHVTGEP